MELKELFEQIAKPLDTTQVEGGRISFSQYSVYASCPKHWELAYLQGLRKYSPTIHTIFGTAVHEVLQNFMSLYLGNNVEKALSLDLEKELMSTMMTVLTEEHGKSEVDFNITPDELNKFYSQGVAILKYFKDRAFYLFNPDRWQMVAVEAPLLVPVSDYNPNIHFLAYLDVVLYDKMLQEFKIIDIKTSTSGWGFWAEKDFTKKSQLYLYKLYLSKKYNIPLEKISIEFLILAREGTEELVQFFDPRDNGVNLLESLKNLINFVTYSFKPDGSYNEDGLYLAVKGKNDKNCRFCEFKDREDLCPKSKRRLSL